MAEVGVLELQIHDNSAKAAEGLGRLATSLNRVKAALGSGLKLGGVANQIGRLTEKLQNAIPEESINRLERLARAVEKLNAAGGINLKGMRGLEGFERVRDAMGEGLERTAASAGEALAGSFEQVNSRVQEAEGRMEHINTLVQQTAWRAGDMADQFRQAFAVWNSMRAAMSLGSGTQQGLLGAAETGWAFWKDGAVPGEGSVSDAMDSARTAASEATTEFNGLNHALLGSGEAMENVQHEARAAANAVREASGFVKRFNPATGQFEDMPGVRNIWEASREYDARRAASQAAAAARRESSTRVANLRDALDNPPRVQNWAEVINQLNGIGASAKSAEESASVFMEHMEQVDRVTESMDNAGKSTSSFTDRLKDLAVTGFQRLKEEASGLKSGITSMLSPLTSLANQFWRIAKMRMIRAVLKQIAEGLKEGVENYYHYSEAIKNGFSSAMDSAAVSMQTFKNSIGAAAAPLIQQLIPVLQTVVGWLTTVINYVNQFLALVTGKKSWSMAVDTTAKAFENTTKAANGTKRAVKDTSDQMKDLLADFDELNIIQSAASDSGNNMFGGGSGGSGQKTQDYLKMFEEVGTFNKDLQALVNNLKENFGSVLNLVTEIGAAVLAWNVSSAFAGILGQLAGLVGAGIVIDLVFKLSKTFTNTYLDTGEEGWLVASALTPLVGGFIAKKMLKNVLGGKLANYAFPIMLTVGASANIVALLENSNVDALSKEGVSTALISALEIGAATGLILKQTGTATALGLSGTLMASGGAALITFGAAVGLKATVEVEEDGKITEDTIRSDAISSAFIGGGLALVAAAAGAGAGTALAVGAGAAVLTFGALIGVQAILQADEQVPVKWGERKLTADEIDAFVGDMFTIKPSVSVELLKSKITLAENSRENLRQKIETTLGSLAALKLGVNQEDSLEQLKTDVFDEKDGLLAQFSAYAKDQVTQVTTTLQFVQGSGKDGKTGQTGAAQEIAKGWQGLNDEMTKLGNELSEAFKTAYDKSLDEKTREAAKESIEKLTQMMTDISNAVAYGSSTANLMMSLDSMAEGITQGSVNQIIEKFKETKNQLLEETKKALEETAKSSLSLAYAYDYLAGRTEDPKEKKAYQEQAEHYRTLYKEQMAQIDEDARRTVEEQTKNSEAGKELARYLYSALENEDLTGAAGYHPQIWTGLLDEMLSGEFDQGELRERLQGRLQSFLATVMGPDNAQTYMNALQEGIIDYSGLFGPEFFREIADSMGMASASKETRDAFVEMIQGVMGPGYTADKILPEMEVTQPVALKAEVVETKAEPVSPEKFDWGDYMLSAGNFEFSFSDFLGADTPDFWWDLYDAMFPEGGEKAAGAADALRERLNKIVETAFLGTGQGNKILEALKNGTLDYSDVIRSSVIQSIEDAMGLEYESQEIQDRWNEILDEIFGGKYAPELEIDPDVSGGATGRKPIYPGQLMGMVMAGTQGGGNGVDPNTQSQANVQAGVQSGVSGVQADLNSWKTQQQIDNSALQVTLNSILAMAQAIRDKEFNVILNPSATFGRMNQSSQEKYSKVTGGVYT